MSKNKLTNLEEKVLSSLQEERNMRSQELFDKNECELQIAERQILDQYIYDLKNPKWRPVIIDGHQTNYEISNTGLLWNTKKLEYSKPYITNKGYSNITICYGNSNKITTFIHRLVANAFIPNPENKPQVNHIYPKHNNKKIKCNWVGNLEWNTAKENIDHAVKNGLQSHYVGEKSSNSKYNNDQIHHVCKLLEENKYLNIEIAKITGVDVSMVSCIKRGLWWTHISKNYNIKKPIKNAKCSQATASKYTDDQIHQVCKMLENPNLSHTTIAKATGVSHNTVYRVNAGINWKDIASLYNIPKRNLNKPKNKIQDSINSITINSDDKYIKIV